MGRRLGLIVFSLFFTFTNSTSLRLNEAQASSRIIGLSAAGTASVLMLSCVAVVGVAIIDGLTNDDEVLGEAKQICSRSFEDSEQGALNACKTGAQTAYNSIYTNYRHQDDEEDEAVVVLPDLKQFRSDFTRGQALCDSSYNDGDDLSLRMACYDGFDALAASVLRRSEFPIASESQITLSNDDFANSDYRTVYNNSHWSDQVWMYVLTDHVYESEKYPAYRREQMYRANPTQSGGRSVSFIPPVRGTATGSFAPTYGPSATPRPYVSASGKEMKPAGSSLKASDFGSAPNASMSVRFGGGTSSVATKVGGSVLGGQLNASGAAKSYSSSTSIGGSTSGGSSGSATKPSVSSSSGGYTQPRSSSSSSSSSSSGGRR